MNELILKVLKPVIKYCGGDPERIYINLPFFFPTTFIRRLMGQAEHASCLHSFNDAVSEKFSYLTGPLL